MTLLDAVQSLGIVELATVSWINIRPLGARHMALFTSALLLPFSDPLLPAELRSGRLRFWPDQMRLLKSRIPIRDQIAEVNRTEILGNLEPAYLPAVNGGAAAVWIIQTHSGSEAERDVWLRSVIALEGRV
jgi:hypothetical protein